MLLRLLTIVSALTLGACATVAAPVGPQSAATSNAVLEQRIEARVLEGRALGTPDLRAMPAQRPSTPPPAELDAQRMVLANAAAKLARDMAVVSALRGPDLAVRAAALQAQVVRDRNRARAEGSLVGRIPARP